MSGTPTNALAIRGLSKTFGGQRALRGVDLEVRVGEIHAIVGENGSGKSTLVKCLSGYHQPDPGSEMWVGGKRLPTHFRPEQAGSHGLAFVHQDLGLIDTLTVAENLLLGHPIPTRFGWRIRKRREREIARAQLAALDHADIDPRAVVGRLSVPEQTIVALARCLYGSEQKWLMVLDEPTAALGQDETERLFEAVRKVAAEGHGVIYISHKLDEIAALADRVTVLRDGERVATREAAELSRAELVQLIVGRPLDVLYPESSARVGEQVVLAAEGICGRRVQNASLSIREGEIVGIAGLLGCGKSELGRLLFGAQPISSGTLRLNGEPLRLRSPADAIRHGIAMVPADRHRNGVHLDHSTGENMTLLDLRSYWRRGLMRTRSRAKRVSELMEEYDVRPRNPNLPIRLLSGGNQQKAVMAKWMHRGPRLLILDEPAQGVDIGAKAEILDKLEAAAERGMAVLLISEEVDDLLHLCDRVLVMRDGRLVADLHGETKTRQQITDLVYEEELQNA